MTVNQMLLFHTATLPCKQIDTGGRPYLQRYFAGTTPDGNRDIWLHRFLSCDGDEHMHNHPWNAGSVVLCGAVTERTESGLITRAAIDDPIRWLFIIMAGHRHPDAHPITMDTWHQITHVEPDTWTLMLVHGDRAKSWQKGAQTIAASPRDWWRGHGCRGDTTI